MLDKPKLEVSSDVHERDEPESLLALVESDRSVFCLKALNFPKTTVFQSKLYYSFHNSFPIELFCLFFTIAISKTRILLSAFTLHLQTSSLRVWSSLEFSFGRSKYLDSATFPNWTRLEKKTSEGVK